MAKVIDYTLFDSRWWINMTWDNFKSMCMEMDIEIPEENSEAYWDIISQQTDLDYDSLFDNLAYSYYKNNRVMITGSIGRWNGQPDIVPVLCDNVCEAVKKCMTDADDYDVRVEDGVIYVNGYHHDGTNHFEIHLLSAKGEKEVDREKYRYEDYEPKKYWFKKFRGYLY